MTQPQRFLHKISAHPLAVFVTLFLVCLGGYWNTLSYPFMMDDYIVLWGEEGVENRTFGSLFTDLQGGDFYRPVGHMLILICHRLFGENYTAYHGVNLVLLAVVAFLFFLIIEALFRNRALAFLTALLYAVHPINNMLVNYITVTVITTYIIMMQLTAWFFIKGFDAKERRFYQYSLLFYVLALLSHEMAIWCPVYIFAIVYFARNASFSASLRQIWPFAAVTVAFFIFRKFFFSFGYTLLIVFAVMSQFTVYITSLMDLMMWYVAKLAVPIDYIFLWTQPMEYDLLITRTCQFFGIIIVLLYFLFGRWKKGPATFGLFFFLCGFLPISVASFVYWPLTEPFIEPHWFYFSSMGFYLMVAFGLLKLRERLRSAVWFVFVAVFLIYCVTLLRVNNFFWKDQKTYCRYWLALNPHNLTPYYWLGRSYLNEGDHKTAIYYFAEGLKKFQHGNRYLLSDLGYAHFLNGENETAMELYRINAKRYPWYSKTYFYTALIHIKSMDLEKAKLSIDRALKLYPKSKLYQRYAQEIDKAINQTQ